MDDDPRLLEIFLDVQRGLPRQGPGCDESTIKALSFCAGLPKTPAILDIGCGPGMQTVALAKAIDGYITALDNNQEYLRELRVRARSEKVAERIEILTGDMNQLPFLPQSFDLLWSEGSAYIMGFKEALTSWKKFLRPRGLVVVSELVWLRPNPPTRVAEFFLNEYSVMTDVESILATILACGYQPIVQFTLPESAWWDHYYMPLEEKLPPLYAKYANDHAALGILETARQEIEIRRLFRDWYGYEFFVLGQEYTPV